MNIFEYKELCASRVKEIEDALLMARARLVAVDEIIALGVSLPNDVVRNNDDTEQSEVSCDNEQYIGQETTENY